MSKTFKHSGDLGDIIYSLPTIQKLGGGVLYLDPTGGEGDEECVKHCSPNRKRGYNRVTKFNRAGCDFITPLLKEQYYIDDVRVWGGEKVNYNLNKHRELFATHHPMNIAEQHLKAFGVSDHPYEEKTCTSLLPPWLKIKTSANMLRDAFGGKQRGVIARSLRYQYQGNVWDYLVEKNSYEIKDSIFIGNELEHACFKAEFFDLPHVKVKDANEMAQIIGSASYFFGNQSFPTAICMGLGNTPAYIEVCGYVPNTIFDRKNILVFH